MYKSKTPAASPAGPYPSRRDLFRRSLPKATQKALKIDPKTFKNGGLEGVRRGLGQSWEQSWANLAQSWSWKASWPILDGPGKAKMEPRWAQKAPRWAKLGPRWG